MDPRILGSFFRVLYMDTNILELQEQGCKGLRIIPTVSRQKSPFAVSPPGLPVFTAVFFVRVLFVLENPVPQGASCS